MILKAVFGIYNDVQSYSNMKILPIFNFLITSWSQVFSVASNEIAFTYSAYHWK